jgi:hypothetical protein
MSTKLLLSGFFWRIAIRVAFVILLFAIGYGLAVLVMVLNRGMSI